MTKVISQDYKDERNWTEAEYVNAEELWAHPIPFEHSEPLGRDFPRPIIRLCTKKKPHDFFWVGSMSIASEAMCKQLVAAGADFEYFEIELRQKDGTIYEDQCYYFIHLLKEVDCFDFERSEYTTRSDGSVEGASKVVLHEEAIGNTPVFTMYRAYMGNWLTSDQFAAQIDATELRGMIFLELNEERWGLRSR